MSKFLLLIRKENSDYANKMYIEAIEKFGGEVVLIYDYSSEEECLDYLKEVKIPCIIHWNFNHFVVLEGFKTKSEVEEAVSAVDSENTIETIISPELENIEDFTSMITQQESNLVPESASDVEEIDFNLDEIEEYIPD
mgnify:CR=1 FL=1